MTRESQLNSPENSLDIFKDSFSNLESSNTIFHMHASRSGPLVSNEIYLSISERRRNPRLETIQGLQQPHGSVGKFLSYWLSGLETSVGEEILSGIELDGRKLYENGVLDKELLNLNADDHFCEWSMLVGAVLTPLLSVEQKMLSKFGFGTKELEDLRDIRLGSAVSFEDGLSEISLHVVNKILKEQGLPIYEVVKFDPLSIKDLGFKYVQRENVLKEFDYLINKKSNQYESAYSTIAKILKSYENFPNENQLTKVFERSWRIDPSFKDLKLSVDEIKNRFDDPKIKQVVTPSYMEQINISLLAHKRSLSEKPSNYSGDIYIDGSNMVKAMFNIANKNDYFLILQEFMRGGNYGLYKELLNDYPDLKSNSSSCRIWDRDKFPEFDQNFVKGLKYLINE